VYTMPLAVLDNSAYDDNSVYTDYLTGKQFVLPDGVQYMATPGLCTRDTAYEYTSESGVGEVSAKSFGIGISLTYDGISISAMFQEMHAKIKNETDNFAKGMYLTQHEMPLAELTWGSSSAGMSDGFKQMLAAMQAAGGSNPAVYDAVVGTIGTHVTTSARLGGACEFKLTFNQSAVSNYSASYREEQFQIGIGLAMQAVGIGVDVGFSSSKWEAHMNAAFKNATQATMNCVGGDPTLANDYPTWAATVPAAPATLPLGLRLRPLWEFLPAGPAQNALKAAVLRRLKSTSA